MTTPTRIGSVIAGKYQVERVLGRGGMGVVVVARHLGLGERVAIKFPIARLRARGDVVSRWMREGRAAMRIHSQYVARVFDVGTLETGEPYLVMEYLVGRDLAAVLAEDGPLPVEEAVEYILQSTEALAEAHAQGIIHRDLKPSNLFLTRGADGLALTKLLDFGTAKSLALELEAPLTGPDAMIGTPLFMAPEQMRSSREIDARADIWGLGATLHTLLTGKPPFQAGSILEIHESILRGAPPLRASRPDAPAALEAALLRCMQTDPSDRYASVAELAEALAEVTPERGRISAVRVARILSMPPPAGETDAVPTGELGFAENATRPLPTDPSADASWFDADGVATIGTSVAPPLRLSSRTQTTALRPRISHFLLVFALAAIVGAGTIDAAFRLRRGPPSAPLGEASAIPRPAPPSTSALAPSFLDLAASEQAPLNPWRARGAEQGAGFTASPPPARGPSKPLGAAPAVHHVRAVTLLDGGVPWTVRSPVRDPLADPD